MSYDADEAEPVVAPEEVAPEGDAVEEKPEADADEAPEQAAQPLPLQEGVEIR